MKRKIANLWGYFFAQAQKKWTHHPHLSQEKLRKTLIRQAEHTQFGKEHHFSSLRSYPDFQQAVPLRSYEAFLPYIERICQGEKDVLWPGRPRYFAESSGTTTHTKYIPITSASLQNHLQGAKGALLQYIHTHKHCHFLQGKMLFLSGSPALHLHGGVPTGRLSGLVNHHVPKYLRSQRAPQDSTNRISDFEEKIKAIVKETHNQSISLISGIPPWVQHYLDALCDYTGKATVAEIFPKLSLYIHGGVNFAPYERRFLQTIGKKIPTLELYPASEGFIAYQDLPDPQAGLLLLLAHGIFYEFVPLSEIDKPNPPRYLLSEVKKDLPYALILNSNAGLWGYVLGDVVSFTSLAPYRIRVVGRTKHFLSAFGEHVIAEEVEKALSAALLACPEAALLECTVAPQVTPQTGPPHHEWLIAFERPPRDLAQFARVLDETLQSQNPYYKDLRKGAILGPAQVTFLRKDAFVQYMRSLGPLDPQHKVPRLSNNRTLAEALLPYKVPDAYVT